MGICGSLGVSSADQLSIYCLVDVGDEMRSATVDLAAPLVINDETHVARQLRHAGAATPAAIRCSATRRP